MGKRLDPLARRLRVAEDEGGLDAIGAELRRKLDIAIGIAAQRGDAREHDREARERDREQGDAEVKAREQLLQRGSRRLAVAHDTLRPVCSTRGPTRSGPRAIPPRLTQNRTPPPPRARQHNTPT